MSAFTFYSGLGVALFALGLYRLVTATHLLRNVVALNVMGAGIFLFLVATAFRNAPDRPDPVPHAMVLTGIVVAVSVTAFAVTLIRKIHVETGRTTLDRDDGTSANGAGDAAGPDRGGPAR